MRDPLAARGTRRRTAPIGPSNGMPDTISAADAPLIDTMSCGLIEVGAEDGGDHLHLVAEALGERRPQRAVGEAAGEDRGLARAALTTEERAGDLARGVHALLDVDREREEVDALTAACVVTTVDSTVVSPTRHEHGAVGQAGAACRSRWSCQAGRIDGAGNANRIRRRIRAWDALLSRLYSRRSGERAGSQLSASELSGPRACGRARAVATDNRRHARDVLCERESRSGSRRSARFLIGEGRAWR